MNENLFSKVNIDRNRTLLPDGMEPDSKRHAMHTIRIIHSVGGVDMQPLGLGHNGHIGFNEPGIAFEKETHCVKLTERTIKANMRFFVSENDVPKEAYTMGIKTIMSAHRILVVVSGEDKAEAVKMPFDRSLRPCRAPSQLHKRCDGSLQMRQHCLCVRDFTDL